MKQYDGIKDEELISRFKNGESEILDIDDRCIIFYSVKFAGLIGSTDAFWKLCRDLVFTLLHF